MKPIFLFLLGVFASLAQAQTPAYLHYGVKDGMPSNLVYCALQTRNGLIWFGTDKGLVCFDGKYFHNFNTKQGLPDPEVLNLFEDSRGRLWISCFRQKPCYYFNGSLYNAKSDTLLAQIQSQSSTLTFSEDAAGNIWMADITPIVHKFSDTGVTRFHFSGPIVNVVQQESALHAIGIGYIFEIRSDGLHQLRDSIINYIEPLRKKTSYVGFTHLGRYYFFALGGGIFLTEFDGAHLQIKGVSKSQIGRVFTDLNGRFWVCSANFGAVCFDNRNHDLTNPVTYLPNKKVNGIMEDRQGSVWFFTTDNGVYMLPRNAAYTYSSEQGFPSNNITYLSLAPDSTLYAGDDEGNIYAIQDSSVTITALGSIDGYNRTRGIIMDKFNRLWISVDEEICMFENGKKTSFVQHGNGKSIAWADSILWSASSKSITYFKMSDYPLKHVTKMDRFTRVAVDDNGCVWAGGMNGIYSVYDSFQFNWGDRFQVLKSRIVALQPAGIDHLWVATPENGLLLVTTSRGTVTAVTIANKFLPESIENVQEIFTQPGTTTPVWVATNRGVIRIDSEWHMTRYDSRSGLADDDINTVLVAGNYLWAGTVNGLSRINISQKDSLSDFTTILSSIQYHDGERKVDSAFFNFPGDHLWFKLPAHATLVQLNLSALDYRSSGNFSFQMQQEELLLPIYFWTPSNLMGTLADWLQGQADASYLNTTQLNLGIQLPAGTFRYTLHAINILGEKSGRPFTVTITKAPLWYETLWFWLVIVAGIVFFVRKIYKDRISIREMNEAISNLQLQALQAQMNPHFVGNSINAIQQFFYPPNPEKASEYIDLFNRLLRRTMMMSEKHFIPFREEMQYDEDYLRMIHLRFGEKFVFQVSGADEIPADTPFPTMILQPLLENATIHGLAESGTSVLDLQFARSGRFIRCIIEDNGIGIHAMQQRQRESGRDRKSKGLEILYHKILTINQLYHIDLQMDVEDLGQTRSNRTGTRITLMYNPTQAPLPPTNTPTFMS